MTGDVQPPNEVVGACTATTPGLAPAGRTARPLRCTRPAGHTGWHRDASGAEFTHDLRAIMEDE